LGFIAGIMVMTVSNSFEMLLFGRMLVGWAVGIGLAIDPLYISEVSPAKHRGELVTWSEIALNVWPTLFQWTVSHPSALFDSLFRFVATRSASSSGFLRVSSCRTLTTAENGALCFCWVPYCQSP
jgi:MFS family permease